MEYRTFRNFDPPLLADVWNTSMTGRGAASLNSSMLLERHVLCKPYFDPNGLFLAMDGEQCVGYAHAGGCQSEDGTEIHGVVCAVMVRPSHRRQGIGTQLLYRCEEYLLERGAQKLFGGGHGQLNPYYAGVYGGSECSGFLKSDSAAEPFLKRHRYQIHDTIVVLQRKLGIALKCVDNRFGPLRNRFNILMGSPRSLGWWEECMIGSLEPIEYVVEDREKGVFAGRALFWEMDAFSQKWGKPAIGILRFEIQEAYRKQGLGKLLLAHLIRQAQEQFHEIAEIHISEKNLVALSLLRVLNFETVDRGQVFVK